MTVGQVYQTGLLLVASLALVSQVMTQVETATTTERPVQFATAVQAPLYFNGHGFVTEVLFILRNVTLSTCLDVCEGTKECDYVKYHLAGHHCTVIQHVDFYLSLLYRNVTLATCLGVCEGTKGCDYVNYHLADHHYTVIEHVDFTLSPRYITNVTLSACLDVCEGTKECDYVNYHLAGHHCTVIEHVDSTKSHTVVNIKGYVTGQKQNWTYTPNPACDACSEYESCMVNATSGTYYCTRQGCGEPTFPSNNGNYTGNVKAVGSQVVVGCNTGYYPAPDQRPVSQCQSNGSWTPVDINCTLYSTSFVCHSLETFFRSVLLSDGSVITYRMFTNNMNYSNAVDTCRNLGAGLVRITNNARFNFVNALMQCSAFSPCLYWVDAHPVGEGFETSGGEPLPQDPGYWTSMPLPNGWYGQCVALVGGQGQLAEAECHQALDYICELY